MKNEAKFSPVPYEDPDKPAESAVPVEAVEKKSAVVLEFPKKIETDKTKKSKDEHNKERVVAMLEDIGILDHIKGKNIFDLEKFLNNDFFEQEFKTKRFTLQDGKRRNTSKALLFDLLADMSVISRQDYLDALEKGIELQEKPLFNIPESATDAFDLENIKSKEYYLNYWDIFGSKEKKQVNWQHSMIVKNGEHLNMKEFAIATELFGKFQGRRDENGNLLVLDPKKNEFIKLNVDWLTDNVAGFNGGNVDPSVHSFLRQQCPNLLEKGLMKLSDIGIKTESASGKLLRAEKFVSKDRSEVTFNGVKYYIGRENFIFDGKKIPTKDIKVVLLDKETAGVVLSNSDEEDVICLIDLLNEDEKAKKRDVIQKEFNNQLTESEISARTFLSKIEMDGRIKNWDCTEENPMFEGEKGTQYARRMRSIARYRYIKKVTDDFALQAGLGIHNLSWREQQWLVSAAFDLKNDYPHLLEFGKTYGIEGLKTFLSCEYGLEHGKEILRIGEKLSPEAAKEIFAKYNEIASAAENNIQDLVKNYIKKVEGVENQEYQKIAQSLLKKGKDLLLNFSEKLKTSKKVDEVILLQELEKSGIDTVFLTSVFKTFAKNNPDISFDYFKNITFETDSGVEMGKNKEDCNRMIAVAQKNYSSDEAMQKLIIESLQEGLENENSQFYILRHNGEIVAFCRFDDEGDHFYAGSFNVDEDYRGSAIGEVMMKESLDKKAQEKPVHAITDPAKKICSKYVEDEGFIIGGILYTEFEGKTLEEVDIIRDDKQNDKYEYRTRYRLEDLEKAHALQQQEIKAGAQSRTEILKNKKSFIATFEKSQEMEKFLKLADKLTKNYGYVITRYLPVDKEGKKMFATFEQKL